MSVIQGCDVSYCQPHLDYAQLQKAGVQFCYHKLGDWKPDVGFVRDPLRDKHIEGFRSQGVYTGDYFYCHVTPSPIDTADWIIKNADFDQLIPVLDMETLLNGKIPPTAGAWLLAALTRIQAVTGVWCIIYGSTSYLAAIFAQAPGLSKYKMWVAEYHANPSPDHLPKLPSPMIQQNMLIYQWCGDGKLPGSPGPIDRDVLTCPDIDQVCV